MKKTKKCIVTALVDMPTLSNLAKDVITSLPSSIQDELQSLMIRVENFPSQDILDELNLQSRYDLLGLYKGIPVPEKQKNAQGLPDIIFLYRAPIILHAKEHNDTIENLIYHVMIHEIGHHFGFSESDLTWIHHQSYREQEGLL